MRGSTRRTTSTLSGPAWEPRSGGDNNRRGGASRGRGTGPLLQRATHQWLHAGPQGSLGRRALLRGCTGGPGASARRPLPGAAPALRAGSRLSTEGGRSAGTGPHHGRRTARQPAAGARRPRGAALRRLVGGAAGLRVHPAFRERAEDEMRRVFTSGSASAPSYRLEKPKKGLQRYGTRGAWSGR